MIDSKGQSANRQIGLHGGFAEEADVEAERASNKNPSGNARPDVSGRAFHYRQTLLDALKGSAYDAVDSALGPLRRRELKKENEEKKQNEH